jgi:hypothetical protein
MKTRQDSRVYLASTIKTFSYLLFFCVCILTGGICDITFFSYPINLRHEEIHFTARFLYVLQSLKHNYH